MYWENPDSSERAYDLFVLILTDVFHLTGLQDNIVSSCNTFLTPRTFLILERRPTEYSGTNIFQVLL